MKTLLDRSREGVRFLVTDVEPNLRPLVAALGFAQTAEGFVRAFPSSSLDVEQIFSRFQDSFEPMLRQLSGADRVPWRKALHSFAELVGGQADWWVVGSAALAVRGIGVAPRDIDLVVREVDFGRVNELLAGFLVEPPSESEDWVARYFCRAYICARVEWVAGVRPWVDSRAPSDFGPAAEGQRELIEWDGVQLRVPPIDLQLAVSKRRGLTDRVEKIESYLRRTD